MIRGLRDLFGAGLHATDGAIGKVHDFYFDDQEWKVRYLVADTGGWLTGRLVLISTAALGTPDWAGRSFPVSLTRRQIEESPGTEEHLPVNRQMEEALARHYNWPTYWGGGLFAAGAAGLYPELVVGDDAPETPPEARTRAEEAAAPAEDAADRRLRSLRDVAGYAIGATDGPVGKVEDALADDAAWSIRYFVVDTNKWLPSKEVLFSPGWTREVSWEDHCVYVDLTKEQIKAAPAYERDTEITREYEERLFAHYGRAPYWREAATAGRR